MTDREPVYRRHRFPAEIIATGSGFTSVFRWACGWSRTCWRPGDRCFASDDPTVGGEIRAHLR